MTLTLGFPTGVMRGLDPRIHVLELFRPKTWMAVTSTAMTIRLDRTKR